LLHFVVKDDALDFLAILTDLLKFHLALEEAFFFDCRELLGLKQSLGLLIPQKLVHEVFSIVREMWLLGHR
jgi:hypothetical protein